MELISHRLSFSFRTKKLHYTPLQIGTHEYQQPAGAVGFQGNISLQPIRTVLQGLCYKMIFSNTLPFDRNNNLLLYVSKYNEDLKQTQLFIAEENTWQGIAELRWPYINIPTDMTEPFPSELHPILNVHLDENYYIYRDGKSNFDECIKDHPTSNCSSIFDLRPVHNQ